MINENTCFQIENAATLLQCKAARMAQIVGEYGVNRAYRVSYVKRDGGVSRFYKPVNVVVFPWRSGAVHGASVFVVGECALGREVCRMLRDRLDECSYDVMCLKRPINDAVSDLIADMWK